MAKMNWGRVRGEQIVTKHGAEAISSADRTLAANGRLPPIADPAPPKCITSALALIPDGRAIGRKSGHLEQDPLDVARQAILAKKRKEQRRETRRAKEKQRRQAAMARSREPDEISETDLQNAEFRSAGARAGAKRPTPPAKSIAQGAVIQHVGRKSKPVLVEVVVRTSRRKPGEKF